MTLTVSSLSIYFYQSRNTTSTPPTTNSPNDPKGERGIWICFTSKCLYLVLSWSRSSHCISKSYNQAVLTNSSVWQNTTFYCVNEVELVVQLIDYGSRAIWLSVSWSGSLVGEDWLSLICTVLLSTVVVTPDLYDWQESSGRNTTITS